MARGENQGLQIALIIFVMVALVLGVSTFYFFQKFDEERQKAAKEAAVAQTNMQKAQEREQERDQLKTVIGVPPNWSMEQISAQLKQDMDTYAAALVEGKKNYREALILQDSGITRKNALVVAEQRKVDDLESLNEAREVTKQVQVKAANEGQVAAQAEQKAEAAKSTQLVEQLKNEKDQLAAAWNAKQNELNDAVKVARNELGAVKRDLNNANRTIKESGEKLVKLTAKTAIVPDGQVVWVDQRNRLAWINLGSEDNLPRQQTFSVHPGSTTVMSVEGKETDTKKAAVEVVRITGAHLAECRILDYSLTNPVIAGDKIFTPAWHPGRQQHFALGGVLDINKDGTDDRAQVKDIIGLAGGIVDLEILSSGEKKGEVTFNTTYFIKGDIPRALGAEDGNSAAVAKTLSQVEVDALNRGARVITLEQFLDDIGYFNRERIFRTGTGDEYTLREGVTGTASGGVRRGNTSELFRRRSPPGAGKSAY